MDQDHNLCVNSFLSLLTTLLPLSPSYSLLHLLQFFLPPPPFLESEKTGKTTISTGRKKKSFSIVSQPSKTSIHLISLLLARLLLFSLPFLFLCYSFFLSFFLFLFPHSRELERERKRGSTFKSQDPFPRMCTICIHQYTLLLSLSCYSLNPTGKIERNYFSLSTLFMEVSEISIKREKVGCNQLSLSLYSFTHLFISF